MNRKTRARFIVLGETTYFRRFDIVDDAGNVVGFEFRQRVIVRDEDGVSRRAYRRVSQ